MTCFDDISVLVDKKYITERTVPGGIAYLIPLNTVYALRENRPLKPKDYHNMTEEDLFHEIEQTVIALHSMEINYEVLCNTCTDIVKSNPQLAFCKQSNDYKLDKDSWVLLLSVCSHYVEEQENLLMPEKFARLEVRFQRRTDREYCPQTGCEQYSSRQRRARHVAYPFRLRR